ncbi:MAG: SCO6745 family protein [Lacisediminihabitans sp.]
MRTREHLARAMWTLFEPIHAVTYFSPQAREEFATVGLNRYWDGYFAGRAAPLGPVCAEPVVAIFSGFAPSLVGRALPGLWSSVSVEQALDARSLGAAAALRVIMPDEDVVAKAAAALAPVAQHVDTIGRPLSAANRVLSEESDPYRRLWQAATTLREHRGDGHVIALVSEEIAGLTTIVLRSAVDADAATMKRVRGWSEDEWDAEVEDLMTRGLLNPGNTITATGAEALNRAEHLTNRLALGPWKRMGDEDIITVARLLAPIARACGKIFPYPNPIGMTQPWNPEQDPKASAVPAVPVTA